MIIIISINIIIISSGIIIIILSSFLLQKVLFFPLQMEIKHPQQCWVHAAQVLYLESCLSGPTGETSSLWEQADFDGVSSD